MSFPLIGRVGHGDPHGEPDGVCGVESVPGPLAACWRLPGLEGLRGQGVGLPICSDVDGGNPSGLILLGPLEAELFGLGPSLGPEGCQSVAAGKWGSQKGTANRVPARVFLNNDMERSIRFLRDQFQPGRCRAPVGVVAPPGEVRLGKIFQDFCRRLSVEDRLVFLPAKPVCADLEQAGLPGGHAEREHIPPGLEMLLHTCDGCQW